MVKTRSAAPTTPVIPSPTLRGMRLNALFIDAPVKEKAVRLFQEIDVRTEHSEPPDLRLIYYFFCQEHMSFFHSITMGRRKIEKNTDNPSLFPLIMLDLRV
jgi:hypothetical protein